MNFEKKLINYLYTIISEHVDSEGVGFMKNEYVDDVIKFIVKNEVSLEDLIELTGSKEYLVSYYAEVAYEELKKNKNLSNIQNEVNKVNNIEEAIFLAQTYHKKSVREWLSNNRYSEVGEMSIQNLLFITALKIIGILKS